MEKKIIKTRIIFKKTNNSGAIKSQFQIMGRILKKYPHTFFDVKLNKKEYRMYSWFEEGKDGDINLLYSITGKNLEITGKL